jgi:hypothetical protein
MLKEISPAGSEGHFTINGSGLYLKRFGTCIQRDSLAGRLEALHCGMGGFDGVFDIAG